MSPKKILFITQEITPYLPESPIADTSRYLPQAIQEKGKEIRTFTPRFGNINERRNQLHEVIRLSGMNIIINDVDHPLIIKVASIQAARMQIYFIDNDDFFKRKGTVANDDTGVEFADNDERSIFFIRGVLESVKKLRWIPDIIHCHGWMSALTPLYIKSTYADDPSFKNTKVIHSLYNDDFKQSFNADFVNKLLFDGISKKLITPLEGEVSYEKLTQFAIDISDGVIQQEEVTNQNILDYTLASKKKFLPYQGSIAESVDAIDNFYDNL